jgi:predicted Zn-dependent peptidase
MRNTAPAIFPLQQVDLIKAEKISLSNGLAVYVVAGGVEEVMRLEIVFPIGNRLSHKTMLANACNYLLNAGTKTRSSFEIMEEIDFYGAFYQNDNQYDKTSLSLYSLNKYCSKVLGVFADIVLNPVFPEKEISIYAKNAKQRLQVNLQKNDFIARRAFNATLFPNHPYGTISQLDDFEKITRDDLLKYHADNYNLSNASIFLSGNITNEVLAAVETHFGQIKLEKAAEYNFPELNVAEPTKVYEHKPDALQTAIRIGKRVINKLHDDYIPLSIVTTLLGGYFGSRLMTNIREEKGYTYGIGAGIMSLPETGLLYIATEVGAQFTTDALHEIYLEVERLQNELVPQEELDLVKNYLRGNYISSIENIFSHADKFRSIHFYGMNYDYYDKYFRILEEITPAEIQIIARRYLQIDSLLEVLVGKK